MVWRSRVIFTRSSRASSSPERPAHAAAAPARGAGRGAWLGAVGRRAAGARLARRAGRGTVRRACSDLAGACRCRAAWPIAASTSSFSTWPRLPRPLTSPAAMPFSAISLAAAGAGGCGAAPLRRRRGAAAAARGGCGAGAPAWARLWRRRPSARRRAFADGADQRADIDRVAWLGRDRLEHAGGRRRHLDGHLVGFELDHRLVGGDRVAHLLEPLADRRLGDAFAQRRNPDVGCHCAVRLSVCLLREALLRGMAAAAQGACASGRWPSRPKPAGRHSAAGHCVRPICSSTQST